MSREELSRRLEEAARARARLRRATLEWKELGRRLLAARSPSLPGGSTSK